MNILILGAGFGGLAAANILAKDANCSVTLIDRNATFSMGLNKIWVAVGKKSAGEGEKQYHLLKRKKINFVKTNIAAIDLERKIVETSERGFSYDYLIIAMGAELVPNSIPGFENSNNLYTVNGAQAINGALLRISKGNLAILVCRTPFKCPPAPYEAAFLIDGYLRKLKSRDKINISFYTPEPQPMPVAGVEVGDTIKKILYEKHIAYYPNFKVKEITKNSMKFENGANANFDLLIAIPPHAAPAVLKSAGLCDESGFVPVDKDKLVTKYENVFAIGDCAAIKLANGAYLPKAGILAEEEAKVVANNILAEISQEQKVERINFEGKGHCFIETGDEKAIKADGNFFAEPSPSVIAQEPSEKTLQEKMEFEKKRLKEWFGM